MAANLSVHSNAFNFGSHLRGGVDSRTGLYTFSANLRRILGNDNLGAQFDALLRSSSLGLVDSGFGKGWYMAVTEFDPDPDRRIISLASGETFKADGRVGTTNQLTMSERKIDSFHLYEVSANRWDIRYDTDVVERLELRGVGKHARAVPTRIFGAKGGHWLDLEYKNHNDYPMLVKITDMRGVTHLEVSRTDKLVELTVLADSGPQTFSLILDGDYRVSRLELPTPNRASWRFSYIHEGGMDLVDQVQTPTGGLEKLYYQDGGHQFPIGSNVAPLPRVTRHVSYPDPGPGQDKTAIDTRYTYSSNGHNFLGGNAELDWINDGLDNLFRKNIDYDYAVTETLWVEDVPVKSTVREFNKFHLLTREATFLGEELNAEKTEVIGDNVVEQINTYNLKPGLFKDQPRYCQLVHGAHTRWWLNSNPTHNRKVSATSTYDDHGNLKTHVGENGVEEIYEWYGKAEPGYPGNEEGFVTHVKKKTEKPAASKAAALPRITNYTYQALPMLASAQAQTQVSQWLEVDLETYTCGDEVQTTHYSFVQAENETVVEGVPLQHGRLHIQCVRFPNPEAAEPGAPATLDTQFEHTYTYQTLNWDVAKERGPSVSGTMQVLQTAQLLTGFDGKTKEVKSQQSLATGETVLNRDDTDTVIMTVWDALLRVEREIVSPGKREEALRRYEYELCAQVGDRALQATYDVNDVMTVAYFDGASRTVREERETRLLDEPGVKRKSKPRSDRETKPTYSAKYDNRDKLAEETEIDWMTSGDLYLTSHYRYDAWEEQLGVIGPDGVGEFAQTDPIGDGKTGPITREWRQQMFDGGGNELDNGRKTGVTETQLDLFALPVQVRRWVKECPDDEKETVLESQTLTEYDGFGLKTKEISGLDGNVNKQTEAFTYDGFQRLVTHSLREGEVVYRTYAAHSDKDLPVKIWVNDLPLLGEQRFDGLDLMVWSSTGGREQTYEYKQGESKPHKVITPEGEIDYVYRPYLTDEPVQRTLAGHEADFVYDPHNARLLSCTEQGGQGFSRTYYTTGEVHTETRGDLDMVYGYSCLGRMESYQDVLKQTQVNTYDKAGRLERTTLGSLSSEFKYDELGRIESYETIDQPQGAGEKNSLKTTLAYDDLERECSRTFTFSHGAEQVLAQEYDDFDRIIERTLSDGTTVLRKETYKYDTRGRLTTYECEGDDDYRPVDPCNKKIISQVFRFDAVDNIRQVLTKFIDGKDESGHDITGQNMAVYHFENPKDPAQLSRITNNFGPPYPPEVLLKYDDNGNLKEDGELTMKYDALNRLIEATAPGKGKCTYGYDPKNILSSTETADPA